jgi:transposase
MCIRIRLSPISRIIENGQQRKQVREFATHATSLVSLRDWRLSEGCTHVGMESTGVYWGPVYRRLYGFFEQVGALAQHIKAVRGA